MPFFNKEDTYVLFDDNQFSKEKDFFIKYFMDKNSLLRDEAIDYFNILIQENELPFMNFSF